MNIDEVIACEEAITSFPFNLMAYEYIKNIYLLRYLGNGQTINIKV